MIVGLSIKCKVNSIAIKIKKRKEKKIFRKVPVFYFNNRPLFVKYQDTML
ncbi:hypothetical protein BH11BAC1_BH11BAC1_28900 [soil metagenome]